MTRWQQACYFLVVRSMIMSVKHALRYWKGLFVTVRPPRESLWMRHQHSQAATCRLSFSNRSTQAWMENANTLCSSPARGVLIWTRFRDETAVQTVLGHCLFFHTNWLNSPVWAFTFRYTETARSQHDTKTVNRSGRNESTFHRKIIRHATK